MRSGHTELRAMAPMLIFFVLLIPSLQRASMTLILPSDSQESQKVYKFALRHNGKIELSFEIRGDQSFAETLTQFKKKVKMQNLLFKFNNYFLASTSLPEMVNALDSNSSNKDNKVIRSSLIENSSGSFVNVIDTFRLKSNGYLLVNIVFEEYSFVSKVFKHNKLADIYSAFKYLTAFARKNSKSNDKDLIDKLDTTLDSIDVKNFDYLEFFKGNSNSILVKHSTNISFLNNLKKSSRLSTQDTKSVKETSPSTATTKSNTKREPKKSFVCRLCRKHRQKCDKLKPSCSRCLKRGEPCHYDFDTANTNTKPNIVKNNIKKDKTIEKPKPLPKPIEQPKSIKVPISVEKLEVKPIFATQVEESKPVGSVEPLEKQIQKQIHANPIKESIHGIAEGSVSDQTNNPSTSTSIKNIELSGEDQSQVNPNSQRISIEMKNEDEHEDEHEDEKHEDGYYGFEEIEGVRADYEEENKLEDEEEKQTGNIRKRMKVI